MIEAVDLTKDYGEKRAVDALSFTVHPGIVTGFLGPNGSGKSTTMRLILGLDRATCGDVTVNGKPYRDHRAPLHEVGALLEARSVHTGRSAYNHLLALAQTHGIPSRRVDELIDLVGLHEVASKRAGKFSLGMGQRLGIAAALLGDPPTLMLDEPVNGLDPEGIHWIRNLLKRLAGEGRTVFVSSHLMSEMALDRRPSDRDRARAADRRPERRRVRPAGRRNLVRVRSPQATQLRDAARRAGCDRRPADDSPLEVSGVTAEQIGELAADAQAALHELTPQQASLEEAFMELTRDDVEFQAELRRRRVSAATARPLAAPTRHAVPRCRLRVDEAALAPLDSLVALRRGRADLRPADAVRGRTSSHWGSLARRSLGPYPLEIAHGRRQHLAARDRGPRRADVTASTRPG